MKIARIEVDRSAQFCEHDGYGMNNFRPKTFVFVLMPFDKVFDDIYQLGIKLACEQAGTYAERVDEQIYDGSILQRIYNQISKADIIVADMSGRNPNVFYETGYAHALGKPVILLTQETEDIPFDLKHYPHIVYNGRIVNLRPELEKRLRFFIDRPPNLSVVQNQLLQVYINEVSVQVEPEIIIAVGREQSGLKITIDLHNPIDRSIKSIRCQIGLITPLQFISSFVENKRTFATTFKIDNERRLHLFDPELNIRAGSWERVILMPATQNQFLSPEQQFKFVTRVITESGIEDHPFDVSLIENRIHTEIEAPF